jgi:hypothetical protein
LIKALVSCANAGISELDACTGDGCGHASSMSQKSQNS